MKSRQWYWMPIAAFLLGVVSTILLILINHLSERQHKDFAMSDVVGDVQLKAATGHLWLEEVITGTTLVDIGRVWADFDQSIALAGVLLEGGQTAHGEMIEPLRDPELRAQAESVRSLLVMLKKEALNRYGEPEGAGIGTDRDARFNELFKEIIDRSADLDTRISKSHVRDKAQSKRLFSIIFSVWVTTVIVVGLLVWNREFRRKRAEEALQEAYDRLEERVRERTAELSNANRRLESEIIEHKLAEEHIKLYEEVFRYMPLGLYVFLHLGNADETRAVNLIAANPAAARFVGAATEDIIGKTPGDTFPFIPETEMTQVAAEVLRSGKTRELGELRYRRAGVGEGFVSVRAFPLPNNCVGVILEDITARKRTEEALRESEGRFRKLSQQFHTLLEAITDPLTLLSPDLKIQWWNGEAGRVSAKKLSDPAGQYCYSVWHNRSTPCEGCPAVRSFRTAREESFQTESPHGKLWELKAFPIKDESGGVISVLTIASDITEKMTLQAEATRAAQLASLGELAAGVAHEINNPINGIINYAQILSDEALEAGGEADIPHRMIREGKRIASIVRSLLSFASERKEEKAPAKVHDILCEALDLVGTQLRKDGIILRVDMPGDLPPVTVHFQQIQQVFLNVINNARYALNQKYPGADKGKTLKVLAGEVTIDACPYVEITFHDHGPGIPAGIREKVMDPFFTTKPRGVGTGLGLSISHGIISDHGGKLTIDSVEGEFTKLRIVLPAGEKDEGKNSRN